jgi:hypothetical protein
MRQSDLENTTPNAFEGLRALRHATELNELQLVSDQFLRALRKMPGYSGVNLEARQGAASPCVRP